ncbi:myelin protein zero-like protein 2b [Eucyclogobius newberryi]|uniref:myelin protein zero-like protein 2b n=1 Tax=Eucyclogobius newberryi TaxID=166745 RepID=UPI003B5ABD48
MLSAVFRICLCVLGGLAVPGVRHVCCIEIITPAEVEGVNGTDVKLKCTFSSTSPVLLQSVTVSWNFRPLVPGPDESVFYFDKEPYPADQGRFKGHVLWSGDILRKDASITLQDVLPTFNGTYICQVRNRPDVHGSNGELALRVVDKVSLSQISMLAIVVGGGIVLILIILSIVVMVKVCRKRRMNRDIEMHIPEEQWKDTTACKSEEAIHLTFMSKKTEGSVDRSGDDEEEDGEEEDHDDGNDD